LEKPSTDVEDDQLLFLKSTRKSPLVLEISFDNKNIIEPLEQKLLDIDEEFKDLRKSKRLIRS
jgi:hypothetical protein